MSFGAPQASPKGGFHPHASGGGGGGGGGGNLDQGKIFVGGLSWQTTEESLRWHFEQYGAVTSVELMKDRATGKPRGFGFVCFADPATVDAVMNEQHEVNFKVVDVKRAQARGVAPPSIHEAAVPTTRPGGGPHTTPTAAGPPTAPSDHFHKASSPTAGAGGGASELTPEERNTKVFIGGLPPAVDRDELRRIMQSFGPVTDCIVMLDQMTQRSRGFGFVTFATPQAALDSIAAQPLDIQGKLVEVKLATPRGGGDAAGASAHSKAHKPSANYPSKFLGLRAGQSSSSSSGEFAGFAVAYGRNGWKAGYGSRAFGPAGWNVRGWDDGDVPPRPVGFSFDYLKDDDAPPSKRPRH